MKNTIRIASFLATATIVGGIIGILFAPARGAIIRRKIKERGLDFVDNINDTIENIKHDIDRSAKTLDKRLKSLNIK